MPAPGLTTAQDVVDYLVDYMGGTGKETDVRDAKRALTQALRDIVNDHKWSYYYALGRISTAAPQTTGTITYDHTGGAAERLMTLTDATWPDWAAYGTVRISAVDYEVAARLSDTTIQLEAASNPGSDLTDATAYQLYRDTYPLPVDFVAMSEVRQENWLCSDYVHPREWLALRRVLTSSGNPRNYTIMGSPDFAGAMTLRLYPHPDAVKTLDFIYYRRVKQPRLLLYDTGSVAVTADATAVAGTGTTWTNEMVGGVLRISSTSRESPTPFSGNNPYAFEGLVASVDAPTSLAADNAMASTYSGVKYTISDHIDVEEGVMLNPLLRCCEKHLSNIRIMKDKPNAYKLYEVALHQAKNADSRNFAVKVAGGEPRYGRLPLNNYPKGSDIG